MAVEHLPSPSSASSRRLKRLMPPTSELPDDAVAAQMTRSTRDAVGLCACAPDAPVVVFVSKMISVPGSSLPRCQHPCLSIPSLLLLLLASLPSCSASPSVFAPPPSMFFPSRCSVPSPSLLASSSPPLPSYISPHLRPALVTPESNPSWPPPYPSSAPLGRSSFFPFCHSSSLPSPSYHAFLPYSSLVRCPSPSPPSLPKDHLLSALTTHQIAGSRETLCPRQERSSSPLAESSLGRSAWGSASTSSARLTALRGPGEGRGGQPS